MNMIGGTRTKILTVTMSLTTATLTTLTTLTTATLITATLVVMDINNNLERTIKFTIISNTNY